ncbi:hypothetical protein ASD81_17345 [Nocardioides sp. Root614]|nr:hypothetical protein ASD81_17345 [Nocardioides sp. Root614]KRA87849.1 hypothetical protein ASD84_17615 [Nocardioides sp. Root682]
MSRDTARYDIALGQVLRQSLEIVPSDAAHGETWSFLALVLLPDVCAARFPDLHADRMIGTPSKHALRRVWDREEVLLELLDPAHPKPLGEDELFQLFDRTALVRDHRLVRALVAAVLKSGEGDRSSWARQLYKRITFLTGARLLDVLSDQELDDLVRSEAAKIEGSEPAEPFSRLKVRLPSDPTELKFTLSLTDAWASRVDAFMPAGVFELDVRSVGAVDAARRMVGRLDDSVGPSEFETAVLELMLDAQYLHLFAGEAIELARSNLQRSQSQKR